MPMRATLLLACWVILGAGCALRPRYGDFVSKETPGTSLALVLRDPITGKVVPNAKLEMSELRNRVTASTGPDGVVTLPVDKKYLDENPVLVVSLPSGITRYVLEVKPPVAVSAEIATEPAVLPADAGMPAP